MDTPKAGDTPRKRATQDLDNTIARFSSPEQKRVAIWKRLSKNPDDPRLLEAFEQLIRPEFIQKAVQSGIYMSYCRADELFALELHDYLCEAGINAWLDMIDVPDDRDWETEVQAALTSSGMMLAILSPAALEDAAWVEERRQFQASGKLVLPVLYQQCNWNTQDLWLPVVDFTRDFDQGLHSLLHVLQSVA